MILSKFKINIYDVTVHLILTEDMEEAENYISAKEGCVTPSFSDSLGLVVSVGTTDYYMVLDSKKTSINTVFHEVFHLASKICDDIDIHDEEAKAWVAGFCGEKIYTILKKKNIIKT